MKKFSELINCEVTQAANDDRKLQQVIARIVPAECMVHVQFCRIENRTLKITLSNASLLARLRFSARQIIDELNREGLTVSDATWHVTPDRTEAQPRPPQIKTRERCDSSAKVVASTAHSMEDDELQRALLKIADQLAKRP